MDPQSQQQLASINRDQQIAQSLGLEPELLEPRESAFSSFFNTLAKPGQAVLGLIDSALIRGDIGDVGIPGAISRAWDERTNTSEILRRTGAIQNPVIRGIAGFAGDVLTDPLNWLSFGTEGLAEAGGRALTAEGSKTSENLINHLVGTGMNAVDAEYAAHDAFQSLGKYSDLVGEFNKTDNPFKQVDLSKDIFSQYDQFKNHLKDMIPNADEYMQQMEKVRPGEGMDAARQGVQDLSDIVSNPDHLPDLFAKKTLDVGMRLPFLGYLSGSETPFMVDATDGTFKKIAKSVGNFINPEKVSVVKALDALSGDSKLGTMAGQAVPKFVGDMFNQFTMSASKGVSTLTDYLKTKPLIGPVVKGVEDGSQIVGDYLTNAKRALYQTFGVSHLLDKKTEAARNEFVIDMKKVNPIKASDDARYVLGENFLDNRIPNDQAGMFFDKLASSVPDDILKYAPNKAEIIKGFQDIVTSGQEITPELMGDWLTSVKSAARNIPQLQDLPHDTEDIFNNILSQKMNYFLKDSTLSPDQMGVIQRLQQQMEKLNLLDQNNGLTHGTIDYYLTHMATNLADKYGELKKAGTNTGFLKSRNYETLGDLFREGNVVGNTDLASIVYQRSKASYDAIAQKTFLERYLLENQSDPELLGTAYKAMMSGDKAGYDFMKWQGADMASLRMKSDNIDNILKNYAMDKNVNLESGQPLFGAAQAEALRKEGGMYYGELESYLKGRGQLPDEVQKLIDNGKKSELRNLFNNRDYVNKLPQDIQDTIRNRDIMSVKGGDFTSLGDKIRLSDALGDFTNEAIVKARAAGVPLSGYVPLKAFGAPAAEYTYNGEKYLLMPAQAKALQEITDQSDILRNAAKGNKTIQSLVDWSDWAHNWTKKLNTIPFPAFHLQNVGDTNFRRLIDEGALGVLNPGGYAEILGALSGEGSIKTARGMITPEAFKQELRTVGLQGSNVNDMLGLVKSMKESDIATLEKRSRGVLSNLQKLELGTAFNKGAEFFQDKFENFFRIANYVHNRKLGSTIPDAINSTNKLLFNFQDLSRTEQSIFKRMYMFYPWIKKSTAQTVNQMYTRPGAILNQIRAARGFAEFFSDPNAAPTIEEHDAKLMNDIVGREEVSFPLGRDADGNMLQGKFNAIPINTLLQNFTLSIPRNFDFSEILSSIDADATRTIQKQAAESNPIFKAIAEKVSGQNLYFNKPLDSAFLRQVPKLAAAAEKIHAYHYTSIPADLVDAATVKFLDGVDNGKGGYIANPTKMWFLTNFVPGLGRAISTANRFADEKVPLPQALVHFFTGIRVSPNDPQRNRLSEVQDNLNRQLSAVASQQQLKNIREGIQ